MESESINDQPAIFARLQRDMCPEAFKRVLDFFLQNRDTRLFAEIELRRSPKSNFNPLPCRLSFLAYELLGSPTSKQLENCFDPAFLGYASCNTPVESLPADEVLKALLVLDILSHGHQRESFPAGFSYLMKTSMESETIPERIKLRIAHHQSRHKGRL